MLIKNFLRLCRPPWIIKVVSTVYLVGEGFNENWMKSSLSLLCREGVYSPAKIFTKGACYLAKVSGDEENWPFCVHGENEMKFNLSPQSKRQR